MKAFATVLLLGQLAFSLPTQQESSPALVPRKVHRESTHVSNFRSIERDTPKLRTRQSLTNLTTNGNGNIVDNGLKYLLPITVGSQTIDVEIDTGSAGRLVLTISRANVLTIHRHLDHPKGFQVLQDLQLHHWRVSGSGEGDGLQLRYTSYSSS